MCWGLNYTKKGSKEQSRKFILLKKRIKRTEQVTEQNTNSNIEHVPFTYILGKVLTNYSKYWKSIRIF